MASCDAYIISRILPGISYEDVIVSCGLNNGIYEVEYADKSIIMMKARNVVNQKELLDKLLVNYEEVSLSELFNGKYNEVLDKLILFTPKLLLDNIDSINVKTVQLAFSMSSYMINKIEEDKVLLTGVEVDESEYQKEVSLCQLEKMKKLKLKPSMDAVQVFYIKDELCTTDKILKNIIDSMDNCLISYDAFNNGELMWHSGESAYDKLNHIVKTFDTMDSTMKKIFIGSLVSGSNFFYRKEFSESLEKYKIVDSKLLSDLKVAGGLWRKVTRIIMGQFSMGYAVNPDEIDALTERLKMLELDTFRAIKLQVQEYERLNNC